MKKVVIGGILLATIAGVGFASMRTNSKKNVPEKKIEKKVEKKKSCNRPCPFS